METKLKQLNRAASHTIDLLPGHINDKLCKIASCWGIPRFLLIESELTKFAIKNWNYSEDRPRRWNEK